MKHNFLTSIVLLCSASVTAQQVSTDIFITEMGLNREGKYFFTAPLNITHRPGYDNQPSFSKDGSKIYYVAYYDSLQSDLFVYDIEDSTTNRLTETPESEFSPRITADDMGFTVIRIDADKGQRFYKILMDGSNETQLLGTTDSAAYYYVINDTTFAVAVLNHNIMELNIYELPNEQFIPLAKNVGRCIAAIPESDNEISYVDKADTNGYMLMSFSLNSGLMGSVCKLKKGVEDYVWTRDGKLLIGFEGKLLMYDKAKPENGWTELVDFSKSVGKFYRIAISPQGNRLALVAVMDDVKKSDSTKEPEPTKEDKKKKKKRE
jgi:hypothetical protein